MLNSFMAEAVIISKPVANQWTGFYMITASDMKELNCNVKFSLLIL